MLLEFMALTVGLIHFATPLTYYAYLRKHLYEPWRFKVDGNYAPRTTIIVPTFDESALIQKRLENIKLQEFPSQKLDVIVVDSGSSDGTAEIAKRWAARNTGLNLALILQTERRGKAHALNAGLHQASGDVVVITDADTEWTNESLKAAISYLSDDSVGAVTALKQPLTLEPRKPARVESTYRAFYNIIRLAESRIHSTPIFHGELAAFRKNLLEQIGGFNATIGADDSHAASLIALRGFRSIAIAESLAYELTPTSVLGYLKWKKRRAVHLIQHFAELLRKLHEAPRGFRKVLATEIFLHLFNPWLLFLAGLFFVASIIASGFSMFHFGIVVAIALPLLEKRARNILRVWLIEQFILLYAEISGLFSKELVWSKIDELRPTPIENSQKAER